MNRKIAKKLFRTVPETFVSHSDISRDVMRATKAGALRRLARRLYTSNMDDPPERVVSRRLWQVVAGYFPGALVADRTALENEPSADGSLFLVTEGGKDVRLPGVTLRPRRGVAALPSDRPFVAGLFVCSRARAFLENMRVSRNGKRGVSRTVPRPELERRLEEYVRLYGEEDARELLGQVDAVGGELGMGKEAGELKAIIASMLGTAKAGLSAKAAVARSRGHPYEPERVALLERLHGALLNHPPRRIRARRMGKEGASTLAFFEAYFTNYIEGVRFTVKEAAGIVFGGRTPEGRQEDARDVLGTWRVVSDPAGMSQVPADFGEFLGILKRRHGTVMAGRPGARPGRLKVRNNRVGQTVFVEPALVQGTLKAGFEYRHSLEPGFQRAAYVHFLVSEVHPFADGNGRAARLMMNAELAALGQQRILIPTVFRDDYISSLRALSGAANPGPYLQVLRKAQEWASAVSWGALGETELELGRCNAFVETWERDETGRRLAMPGEPGR